MKRVEHKVMVEHAANLHISLFVALIMKNSWDKIFLMKQNTNVFLCCFHLLDVLVSLGIDHFPLLLFFWHVREEKIQYLVGAIFKIKTKACILILER